MEEIMQYSTYLEGARENLSEDETKTILFTSFPVAWQINYKCSQPPLQRSAIRDGIIFMSQEKSSQTPARRIQTADKRAVATVDKVKAKAKVEVEAEVEMEAVVKVVEATKDVKLTKAFIYGRIV